MNYLVHYLRCKHPNYLHRNIISLNLVRIMRLFKKNNTNLIFIRYEYIFTLSHLKPKIITITTDLVLQGYKCIILVQGLFVWCQNPLSSTENSDKINPDLCQLDRECKWRVAFTTGFEMYLEWELCGNRCRVIFTVYFHISYICFELLLYTYK